jgi:hypothetical protein
MGRSFPIEWKTFHFSGKSMEQFFPLEGKHFHPFFGIPFRRNARGQDAYTSWKRSFLVSVPWFGTRIAKAKGCELWTSHGKQLQPSKA